VIQPELQVNIIQEKVVAHCISMFIWLFHAVT
jgi:hypothetical protein